MQEPINPLVDQQLRVIAAQMGRLCGPELEQLGRYLKQMCGNIYEVRADVWGALEKGFQEDDTPAPINQEPRDYSIYQGYFDAQGNFGVKNIGTSNGVSWADALMLFAAKEGEELVICGILNDKEAYKMDGQLVYHDAKVIWEWRYAGHV